VQHLNGLNKAYDVLLDNVSQQLKQAFVLDTQINIKTLREQLSQRYAGLEHYTVDDLGLKAFIIRLQNSKDTDKA